MFRMLIVVAITVVASWPDSIQAQDQKQPLRLLFIGNSLTNSNDMPKLVEELIVHAKLPRPEVESFTMPGASLGDHWTLQDRKERILAGKWNYVILQQGPSSLLESRKELLRDMETAKPWLKESGAKAAMFMVWPDTTRKRFFPQVRDSYAQAAKSVDGVLLPAGLALQKVMADDPALSLFNDGLHPTPIGSYLAGMVIASRLAGIDPEKYDRIFSWGGSYSVKLTAKQHSICINAVKEALKDQGK